MIVSLAYKMVRKLLSVPSVLLRRDTTKDAGLIVLRQENTVLRRQPASPVLPSVRARTCTESYGRRRAASRSK
ncbi:hypothetical protein ACIQ8G_26410 [Streptomyces sp. NPDC094154]|uniref:hypothetical protein n=1 Tax=Streptomyces sp. NPDC094154 TaxID=3366059 RepID=UPI00382ABDA3